MWGARVPPPGSPRHRQQLCPQAVARFLMAGRTREVSSGSQAESGRAVLLECQGRRGQMVRVHQGTEPSPALSPHAAGRIRFRLGGSCRGAAGDGIRERATRHSHRHLRPAAWHPALLRKAGSFLGRTGLGIRFLCLDNLTSPPRSSILALKLMKWHQTSPRSAPQPWEQWVIGKRFSFNHCSGGTAIQE